MEQGAKKDNALRRLLRKDISGMVIALIVICVVISILEPVFFSTNNIMNILRQN